jgi:CheY-like chemotaxis protein
MVHVPERRLNGRSHEERIAWLRALQLAWSRRSMRVLLVDCIPDEQSMYTEFLEHAGVTPVVVCDSSAAFQIAASAQPEVVVIDLGSNPENTLELLQQFRADTRTRHAAIIVISGHVFPNDQAEAMRAGADVFLPKPCLPETLLAEILRLFQQAEDGRLARPSSP